MAQQTINPPAHDAMAPNTRDSSEYGDSFKAVIDKINAMFTELYALITGTALALLPNAQYSTAALESAAMAAANVAGAKTVVFVNTGTTPGNLQMPTAAAIVAAIPNAVAGFSYMLEIRNASGSANTATITTNTGITLSGTMTIAQNVTRRFIVTLDSLTAVTVRSVGLSAAGA